MSDDTEETFHCPECDEVFSSKETKERNVHCLEEHDSFLRWVCRQCTYTTNTHRRHDHIKHWAAKHSPATRVRPRPRLVPREEEERRFQQERSHHDSRGRRSSDNPARLTRSSSRDNSEETSKRRHKSSPTKPSRPDAKRRSGSPQRTTPRVEDAPASTSSSAAASQAKAAAAFEQHRSPRKSDTPRRVVRRRLDESLRPSSDEDEPVPGTSGEQPVASPAQSEAAISIHAAGDDNLSSDDTAEEPPVRSSEQHVSFIKEFCDFLERSGTIDDCQKVAASVQKRQQQLTKSQSARTSGLGTSPQARRRSPSQPRLTWRPDGGISVETENLYLRLDGPVNQSTLKKD